MNFIFQPWQFFLLILAGWMNREQQQIIEYQDVQLQVLKEVIGKKRILLNDSQRRRLAVKGKILGWKRLHEIQTLFTPDTILRWHRQLIKKKWDYSGRRKRHGRPPVDKETRQLIVKLATENPDWGYDRIQGVLKNLGIDLADQTIGNILKENGIEPSPERSTKTSWKTFIKSHWDVLASIDFTTVEVWTRKGLITYYLLFVMGPKTRKVHFAGSTTNPNETWLKQIVLNLTDHEDGFLIGSEYLIMDRDTKFCKSFKNILDESGIKPVMLPPRSPNLNSHLERFFGSLKRECLNKMIFFGENSLRNAVKQYLEHYHTERNHQGLENTIINADDSVGKGDGAIECKERLGGLLNYYHRSAA